MKVWIAEQNSRATFTMLVDGRTRKEALENLALGLGEGVNTDYHHHGPQKIIREDKIKNKKKD